MKRLIVNADDFGLTGGVNRAVAELHRAGVLTSATLMARAAATAEAVALAQAEPRLGVGCHVVLADGEPMSGASRLVDPQSGLLYPTLGKFLPRVLSGQIRAAEIEAEAEAQIAALQAAGVRLTHIDAHKHTHMFPAVLRPLLRAARRAGIGAVRNPFEPLWALRATPGAPWVRRSQVRLLRALEPGFRRMVAEAGMSTTDGAIGVLATGTLDARTVESLAQHMPDGTWELVAHPGYHDAELRAVRTRLQASRETEREALLALRQARNVQLISFADLSSAQ